MNDKSMWQMMIAATKMVRGASVMVTAMRVAGNKEGEGNEEDNGIGDEGVCNKEGNGNGCKSDGNEGDGRATATRAMAMAKANNTQPVTRPTKAGGGQQERVNKATTRPQRWAMMNDKSVRRMMMTAMKRARVERAKMRAMRVVGDKEGEGNEEEDGIGNKGGNGNGCNSNGNKSDG
jgi:hypothetical protein